MNWITFPKTYGLSQLATALLRRGKAIVLAMIIYILVSGLAAHATTERQQNDDLFPPGPSAAKYVNFDGRGFILNGKRTFLVSGSIHYARVPQSDWYDILLKLKRSGFNTVQTYVFWNYHEPEEGVFDFSSEGHDLGAFLDTARALGLYAIVRVGPYICGEWENGGFPNWLYFKPGLEVRRDNAPFLHAVDGWFNRMLPIIASRQIQNGGNVILVQLENEQPTDHWADWGTNMDGPYDQHLLSLARANGIEVPMFFSGLHHGHDPAPQTPVDHRSRKSPWMTTELWTTWFDRYGVNDKDLHDGERHAWRVLAEGGNGFNLYMFHGGTTFGYFGFNENHKPGDKREQGDATYDYGTLVGQTGNTTTLYAGLKRLAYFADSFSSVLANSDDSSARFKDFAAGVSITARTAPEGTLVFLDNTGDSTTARLKNGAELAMDRGEIVGIPVQFPLPGGVILREADTRVLGLVTQKDLTTIVCYGQQGKTGQLILSADQHPRLRILQDAAFTIGQKPDLALVFTYPADNVGEAVIQYHNTKIRILVMNMETADRTWFVSKGSNASIVVGAYFLRDLDLNGNGSGRIRVDTPIEVRRQSGISIYTGNSGRKIQIPDSRQHVAPELHVNAWMEAAAFRVGGSGGFKLSDGSPPIMAQDGDNSPYAWYRVKLDTKNPVHSLCFAHIGDRATFLVDDHTAADYNFMRDKSPCVTLQITSGRHVLTVFVAHAGRSKFAGYTGPINILLNQKGLSGPALLNGDNKQLVTGWEMWGGVNPDDKQLRWRQSFVSDGKPSYFRTTFDMPTLPQQGIVYRFLPTELSYGTVWVNGHNIGRYPEIVKNCPGLWIPSAWMKRGENRLEIFDETGRSPEHAQIVLEAPVSRVTAEKHFQ